MLPSEYLKKYYKWYYNLFCPYPAVLAFHEEKEQHSAVPADCKIRLGRRNIEFLHVVQTDTSEGSAEYTAAVDMEHGIVLGVDDLAVIFRSVEEGGIMADDQGRVIERVVIQIDMRPDQGEFRDL